MSDTVDTIEVFNASASPQAVDGAGVMPPYERAVARATESTMALLEDGVLKEVPEGERLEDAEGNREGTPPATPKTKTKKKEEGA